MFSAGAGSGQGPTIFEFREEWVLTKRWLACLLGAVALLNGCATTEKHPVAVQAPTPPPPPPPQTLPLKSTERVLPPEVASLPDATDLLVKQVDALYLSGMNDFRAGNLEKSKAGV